MGQIKIGFGGSCHWCTEAIFRSIIGVVKVEQGWLAGYRPYNEYSEGVIVEFDPNIISLEVLIDIHLSSHKSESNHSMREKYRSAVYTFSHAQYLHVYDYLLSLKRNAPSIVTETIPCLRFKLNCDKYIDYYYSNPSKPFCENVINPKLMKLMKTHSRYINTPLKANQP